MWIIFIEIYTVIFFWQMKISYCLKFATNSWHKTCIKTRKNSLQERVGRFYLSVHSSHHFQLHNLDIFTYTFVKAQKSLAAFGIPGIDILFRVRRYIYILNIHMVLGTSLFEMLHYFPDTESRKLFCIYRRYYVKKGNVRKLEDTR